MSFFKHEANLINGKPSDFRDLEGKVVLVVNTASQCGLAKQLKGLESLYQDYRSEEFIVLGFPSDDFGNQELDDPKQIFKTCRTNYGVTFPMFEKVKVKGSDAHPVFKWLKRQKRGLLGHEIRWNYTKFLIDREGQVIKRFGPLRTPEKLRVPIARAL